MKQLTQIGSSVEDAIQLALQKLGTTREQVDVEVLQEGKKGFLGFGARPSEVRVTMKEQIAERVEETAVEELAQPEPTEQQAIENGEITESVTLEEPVQQVEQQIDPVEEAKAYLTDIAQGMGVQDLVIETTLKGKYVYFSLESEKAAYLIGKRGQTLNALQQLTQLVLNKSSNSFLLARLDVENYRERREQALEILADRMADKAVRTGKTVQLEPMPSSERKVIHNQLANRLDIETYSEGVEPNRYLVIEPLK